MDISDLDDSLFDCSSTEKEKRVDVSQVKYEAKRCELNVISVPTIASTIPSNQFIYYCISYTVVFRPWARFWEWLYVAEVQRRPVVPPKTVQCSCGLLRELSEGSTPWKECCSERVEGVYCSVSTALKAASGRIRQSMSVGKKTVCMVKP